MKRNKKGMIVSLITVTLLFATGAICLNDNTVNETTVNEITAYADSTADTVVKSTEESAASPISTSDTEIIEIDAAPTPTSSAPIVSGNTGYILIGESHISMSETAVINHDGIQTLSNGDFLTLGKDLFFIHTIYLNGTEPEHDGSEGSYESLQNTAFNFAGAYPGWLNTDGFSYNDITDLAGQSAATRIKKIIDNNSAIDNWVFVILQGYTASSTPEAYESYKDELVIFSNTISDYAANTNVGATFYFVGCVRNNDAAINSNIIAYNDYLKTNLQGTKYTYYDWSDSWENNYDFQDSNHLTFDAYYQIWNDHLGNELRPYSYGITSENNAAYAVNISN